MMESSSRKEMKVSLYIMLYKIGLTRWRILACLLRNKESAPWTRKPYSIRIWRIWISRHRKNYNSARKSKLPYLTPRALIVFTRRRVATLQDRRYLRAAAHPALLPMVVTNNSLVLIFTSTSERPPKHHSLNGNLLDFRACQSEDILTPSNTTFNIEGNVHQPVNARMPCRGELALDS